MKKVEGNSSCDKLDEPDGTPVWHCDPADSGEAVQCITNKDLNHRGANRCCNGKWLFTAQASFVSHGFTIDDAKAWSDKCDNENCCRNVSSGQCYRKQLAELGRLADCSSIVLV